MPKKIKVLFQSRVDLFKKRGGDTYQIEHTKKAIERLYPEYEIDIDLSVINKNIVDYDIVNLFNLDWICETYPQAVHAKKHLKPLVLSAIHHPVDKILLYEKNYRYDVRKLTNTLIRDQGMLDILKNVYRSFYFPQKITPTILQSLMGAYTQQKKVVEISDAILVQTYKEKEELIQRFKCEEEKYHRVVLGVDAEVFINSNRETITTYLKEKNIDLNGKKVILNIGRIEPRKNQLSLIQAFHKVKNEDSSFNDYVLMFVGEPNNYHPGYNRKFQNEVKKDDSIIFLGKLPQDVVASAMKLEGIYIQTSWFETFGLTHLEAFISGMKVVTTIDRIEEFFGDKIVYCEPQSINSISEGLKKSSRLPDPSKEDIKHMLETLNWEQTAHQTVEVYRQLLSKQ